MTGEVVLGRGGDGGVLVQGGPAGAPRGVDDGEVQGMVVGAELHEQVEDLVDDLVDARIRRSHLLITTMGLRPNSIALESTNRVCGMAPSEESTRRRQPSARRRTRSTSPPKSEVGVAGGIDDVDQVLLDRVVARGPEVGDGAVLGEDGDPALALQGVGVHDEVMLPAGELFQLPGAEHPRLLEELVHERGLAVVDVGDDRDVTNCICERSAMACGTEREVGGKRHDGESSACKRTEPITTERRKPRLHRLTPSRPSSTQAGRSHFWIGDEYMRGADPAVPARGRVLRAFPGRWCSRSIFSRRHGRKPAPPRQTLQTRSGGHTAWRAHLCPAPVVPD